MPRFALARIVPVLVLGLLVACQEKATEPPSPSYATDAWCAANPGLCGPGDPDEPSDPDPQAPGYWMGPTITYSTCVSTTGAGISDGDRDALSDHCEDFLAQRFRPSLIQSSGDCGTGGEPYWAAKVFPAKKTVRIAYLFAYYVDCGPSPSLLCTIGSIGSTFITVLGTSLGITIHDPCDGHQGDSEFVTVDLLYNATTQHWYVASAFFSAHWSEGAFDKSRRATYSQLEYPEKSRGYFRVYVAEGKHANYPTRSVCEDDGGLSDRCAGNTVVQRIRHANQFNVGSLRHNFINAGTCVRGGALFAYYPENYGTECFWQPNRKFRGWSKYQLANDSNPYHTVLTIQFECYSYTLGTDAQGRYVVTCTDWGVNT